MLKESKGNLVNYRREMLCSKPVYESSVIAYEVVYVEEERGSDNDFDREALD